VTRYVLYADGAARGNPGPAGAGAVLLDERGTVVFELRRALGRATNNVAEYEALVMGLEEARRRGIDDLVVRVDSELVARQLRGTYRVKSVGLAPLAQRALRLLSEFGSVLIQHVPREQNVAADRLANQAIDGIARHPM
jgi:ribonuclease HI